MTPINISHVYCILNIHNGKRYVGSTTSLSLRKRQHLFELRKFKHPSRVMQADYITYGEDAFKMFSLEEVFTFEREELFAREQHWIDLYKPEYNTNELAGNHIPKSGLTKEARQKQARKVTGRKQSQEEKDKRANSIKKFWSTHPAKTIPQAIREHLSKINTGEGNPNWGLKRTEETRKRISESNSKVQYTFKSPSGELFTFTNLSKAPIPLPYWRLRQLYRGQKEEVDGWTFVGGQNPP